MEGRRSAYDVWIEEAWEAYCASRAAEGEPTSADDWQLYLRILSFSYLERAHTLLAHVYDPAGESVDEHNRAAFELLRDVKRLILWPDYEVTGDPIGSEWPAAVEERVAELRAMPYPDYLGSSEWAQQRRWALERAEYRCETCGSTNSLNVHHSTYERRGQESPDDLVVLCRPCHEAVHRHGGSHRPRTMR